MARSARARSQRTSATATTALLGLVALAAMPARVAAQCVFCDGFSFFRSNTYIYETEHGPSSRVVVVPSHLITDAPAGSFTFIRGTRAHRETYRFIDTFPSTYIGWNPFGLYGDIDAFGRFRSDYPYGVPRWGYYPGTHQGGVVVGETQRISPDDLAREQYESHLRNHLQTLEKPAETTMDHVVALLRNGDFSSAVDAFDAFGALPGDFAAPWPDGRFRAVALAGAERFDEASTAMLDAYFMDPALAGAPLVVEDLAPSARDLRAILNSAVQHAHKAGDPAHWLLVAALMQSEGRIEPAAAMIGRARDAGLDAEIVVAFEAVLGPLPEPPPE